MSERDSRSASASSALTASIAVNPASSTMSTARKRSTISSSTTSTFVGGTEDHNDMKCFHLVCSIFVDRKVAAEGSFCIKRYKSRNIQLAADWDLRQQVHPERICSTTASVFDPNRTRKLAASIGYSLPAVNSVTAANGCPAR